MKRKFKQLREKLGRTMMQVAEDLKMPLATYQHYEDETREPDFDTLFKIADYYRVTIDYLLGRTEINEPPVDSDLEMAYQLRRLLEPEVKQSVFNIIKRLEKANTPTNHC